MSEMLSEFYMFHNLFMQRKFSPGQFLYQLQQDKALVTLTPDLQTEVFFLFLIKAQQCSSTAEPEKDFKERDIRTF